MTPAGTEAGHRREGRWPEPLTAVDACRFRAEGCISVSRRACGGPDPAIQFAHDGDGASIAPRGMLTHASQPSFVAGPSVLVLAAALVALAAAAPAAAATPTAVEIVSHMDFNQEGGFNTGDFEASGPAVDQGLICESGTVEDTRLIFGWVPESRRPQSRSRSARRSRATTGAARSSSRSRSTSISMPRPRRSAGCVLGVGLATIVASCPGQRLSVYDRRATAPIRRREHRSTSVAGLSFDSLLPGHGLPIVGGAREALTMSRARS